MNTSRSTIRLMVPIRYPVGGIRTYLKYTYGNLDVNKYAFDFLAPSRKWLGRIKKDLANFEVTTHVTKKEDSNLALLFLILKLIRNGNYQLIHSQGYTAGILSNIANMIYKLPHMVTLHHIFGHGQFSDSFWKRFKWMKKKLIQNLLARSDVIQAVSYDAMTNLVDYFPGLIKYPNKLVTIVNGIDIDQFSKNNDIPNPPFKKEKGLFYVGFIGRFMPEKGFGYLIEAMDLIVNDRKIDNIRIVSAGGFGGFIREYKKEITKKNLDDFFIFFEFFENIEPFLKNVDILAIPSLGEACGLAAMEGLVCGTPVVAFRCMGVKEVLSDTPAIMVEVGDVEGLTEAIMESEIKYQAIKHASLEFVQAAKTRYDSKKATNDLEKIIWTMIRR